MKTKLITLIAAILGIATSCIRISSYGNNGNDLSISEGSKLTPEQAAAKGFQSISVSGSFKVYYTQGGNTSVRLKGSDEAIANTELKCDGRKLCISTKKRGKLNIGKTPTVEVYITSPQIDKIGIAGSGSFTSREHITATSLYMDIAGSGSIKLTSLDSDKCGINIAGSGNAHIGGIEAKKATASIAGSGDIKIENANIGQAKCDIAGSGDIDIRGHVENISQSVAGSGSVNIRQ